MNAPATRGRFWHRRPVGGALAAALFALPVLGTLFSFLLPRGDAYEAGGLPLLAALGGLALTGCAAHYLLVGSVAFDRGALLRACAAFSYGPLLAAPAGDECSVVADEPSPLVPPLLSSYFALYAGLCGWVDGRTRAREAADRSAGNAASR